jgi:hypothetical protein
MTNLHPFDSAEHLETEADVAAYLEACAAEEDPALMAHALGKFGDSSPFFQGERDQHQVTCQSARHSSTTISGNSCGQNTFAPTTCRTPRDCGSVRSR